MNKWHFILFSTTCLWFLIKADVGNNAYFTNLKCTVLDPSYVIFTHCRLKALNRSLTALTVNAQFLQPPVKSAMMHLKFNKRANGYKPFLIDITFDVCAFLSGHNIPVFKPFYLMAAPYANINSSCPLPEFVIINNLPLRIELIPSTWPSGDYRIDVTFITSNVKRSLVNVHLVVMEKFIQTNRCPKNKRKHC